MEKQKLGLIIAIIILIGIITILSGYIIGLNQNSIENANNTTNNTTVANNTTVTKNTATSTILKKLTILVKQPPNK